MSTLLAPSVIVRGDTFTLEGPGAGGVYDPVTVWTTPATTAVQIDAVFMVAEYNGLSGYLDVFALALVDVSGVTLCSIRSGLQMGGTVSAYELTWMVDGVDTGAGGEAYWNFEDGESGNSWWSGALPPIVLNPASEIVLSAFRGNPVDSPDSLLMDQVSIAYTPAGGASTASDLADVLPFLLPAAGSST